MKVMEQIKLLNEKEAEVVNVIKSFGNDRFKAADIVEALGESRQNISKIMRSFQLAVFVVKEEKTYFRASKRLQEYFSSL